MKKFFSFVVAVFATIAVSAQTYDLTEMNFTQEDLTVTDGTVTEDAKYLVVKNNEGATVTMTVKQLPDMVFSYKNSAVKTAFKVYPNKIQLDGNQRDLTFNNITPGTTITLSVASKGSTAASFEDSESKGVAFTGCVHVSGERVLAPKADGEEAPISELTVMATAPTVTIRETAGGYVLTKVVIGNEDTALQNATVENKKAQKVIENGVVYIIKNGVKYNVLGAVVE